MASDEKIVVIFFALFGAAIGCVIFFFAVDGMGLPAGRPTVWWKGWPGLLFSAGVGAVAGGISYKLRHFEFASAQVDPHGGVGGAVLLMKRVGVILGGVVAIYYLWDL